MAAADQKIFKVGIIIGSNRPLRAGPQIATFVHDVIMQHEAVAQSASAGSSRPQIRLSIIDIATLNLPFLDEPKNPRAVADPSQYVHAHTRAWSKIVTGLDAFVIVTPQYNWGIPAGLKNALDFLYREWNGKPVMVVSYGGHGGDKAAAALRPVLEGAGALQMRLVEKSVGLAFPSRDFMIAGSMGKELGLDAKSDSSPWADKRADIVAAWEDLGKLLVE